MKRMLAVGAGVVLFGCGGGATVADFRGGIPSSDAVAIKIPDTSGSALREGSTSSAALGATAGTYLLTRTVTAVVNGGTVLVLGIVKTITSQTPSSFDGNTAVWGPYTDSLSPTTWKLTVMKTGDHTFSYALEGKDKSAADSAYVVVLSGTHTPSLDSSGNPEANFGNGTFLIDWDKAATLPEHGNEVGTAAFTYSRLSSQDPASVDVAFRGTRRLSGNGTTDADYHWQQTAAGDGEFTFATDANVDNDANDVAEDLAIKSRWQSTGAGRADVIASNGDLPQAATLNECWSATFQSTYLNESFDSAASYGDEATDCAFTSADYPTH